MAALKVSAATRERRKHQGLRDRLWRMVRDNMNKVRQGATVDGNTKARDHAVLSTAIELLDALRDTGAK